MLSPEQYDKCRQVCLDLGRKYNNLMAFEGFNREPIKIKDVDLIFEAFYLKPEQIPDFIDDFADFKIALFNKQRLYTSCIAHNLDDTIKLYLGDVRSILRHYWEGKSELTQNLKYGEEAPLFDYYGNHIDRSDALKNMDKICEVMSNIIHSYNQSTGSPMSPLDVIIAYWMYTQESLAQGLDVPHIPFRNHLGIPYDEILAAAIGKLIEGKVIETVGKGN